MPVWTALGRRGQENGRPKVDLAPHSECEARLGHESRNKRNEIKRPDGAKRDGNAVTGACHYRESPVVLKKWKEYTE